MEREKYTKLIRSLVKTESIIVIFLIGAILHLFQFLRPLLFMLTPILQLFYGIAALYWGYKREKKFFYTSIVFVILTLIIEIIGVKTGLVFGVYSYGSSLQPQLFGVPIIIGFNWVILIYASRAISEKITNNQIYIPLLTALLTTLFDYILEPVAISLSYWSWGGIYIPLHNYIAWFIISFLMSVVLGFLKFEKRNDSILITYFLAQLIFFILLRITLI